TSSATVTAAAGCTWTAVSNDGWITVNTGASGNGNGAVSYSVGANTLTTSRTGTMTIAGITYTVNQTGAPCSYALSGTPSSFSATPTISAANVTAAAGCTWTAVSNDAWLTVTSGASGNGNGTVNYSVTANTVAASRTGTMTIAGITYT